MGLDVSGFESELVLYKIERKKGRNERKSA